MPKKRMVKLSLKIQNVLVPCLRTMALSVSLKLSEKNMALHKKWKMKFSIKDFFSKCHKICSFLKIWSYLLTLPSFYLWRVDTFGIDLILLVCSRKNHSFFFFTCALLHLCEFKMKLKLILKLDERFELQNKFKN